MNREKINIYEPNQRLKVGIFKTWYLMVVNIIQSKDLLVQLFKRDFFATYKKSFLGLSWLFIAPIIGILSWVFLEATNILDPGDVGIPYPAFVLISSSMWGLFMGFYSSGTQTLSTGSGFIMQVKYPHEVLLIKQTAQHLANFTITFVVNIVVLVLFNIDLKPTILLLPLVALPMFFVGAGLGLIVSVISVVASDLSNIIGILLGFIYYLTPIVYTIDKIESPFRDIVELNPFTYLIGEARDLILFGKIDKVPEYLVLTLIAFIFFLLSWRLFYVSEDKVIERMV